MSRGHRNNYEDNEVSSTIPDENLDDQPPTQRRSTFQSRNVRTSGINQNSDDCVTSTTPMPDESGVRSQQESVEAEHDVENEDEEADESEIDVQDQEEVEEEEDDTAIDEEEEEDPDEEEEENEEEEEEEDGVEECEEDETESDETDKTDQETDIEEPPTKIINTRKYTAKAVEHEKIETVYDWLKTVSWNGTRGTPSTSSGQAGSSCCLRDSGAVAGVDNKVIPSTSIGQAGPSYCFRTSRNIEGVKSNVIPSTPRRQLWSNDCFRASGDIQDGLSNVVPSTSRHQPWSNDCFRASGDIQDGPRIIIPSTSRRQPWSNDCFRASSDIQDGPRIVIPSTSRRQPWSNDCFRASGHIEDGVRNVIPSTSRRPPWPNDCFRASSDIVSVDSNVIPSTSNDQTGSSYYFRSSRVVVDVCNDDSDELPKKTSKLITTTKRIVGSQMNTISYVSKIACCREVDKETQQDKIEIKMQKDDFFKCPAIPETQKKDELIAVQKSELTQDEIQKRIDNLLKEFGWWDDIEEAMKQEKNELDKASGLEDA